MLKEAGYQEKIEMLKQWLEEIVEIVKRDLKQEHLKIDREFCRKYFLGKTPQSLTAAEMTPAYFKDIQEGNVGLGEFIASRWLLKNTDIYGFFEEELRKVNPDFEAIEKLSNKESHSLMQTAVIEFGAKKTYIFSVFNSVVFDERTYQHLKNLALEGDLTDKEQKQQLEEEKTLAGLKKQHERELASLKERFENKLKGMEKKYLHDTEALKRQISALQRKVGQL